jgi:hypothetical protein
MAQIVRVTKAGSTDGNYVTGTTIRSAEVNADINGIITVVNSQIANDNIANGAAIAYAKLALTGSILNADIATSAAIVGSKLASQTITTDRIAIGNTTAYFTAGAVGFVNYLTTTETTVASTGGFTSRGGPIYLFSPGMVGQIVGTAVAASPTLTIRIRRGGTEIVNVNFAVGLPAIANSTFPIIAPAYVDVPGAGTFTYTLTIQLSSVANLTTIASVSTVTGFAGWIAMEPA